MKHLIMLIILTNNYFLQVEWNEGVDIVINNNYIGDPDLGRIARQIADTVTVSVYNPVKEQCQGDPTITADGSKINLCCVNKLRWCALSRDLLSRWGGPYNYGDTITLSGNPLVSGEWIVHDCMNSRYKNSVDLLQSVNGLYGKWKQILIKKKT